MMTSRRALIPDAELRRWAKVVREEGVEIHGRRAPDGSTTVIMMPAGRGPRQSSDDLDAAIDGFLTP